MIRLCAIIPLLLLLQVPSAAQVGLPSDGVSEFYRSFSLDANRRPIFCNRLDSASEAARSYGVRRDSAGRVSEIRRFFFGNLDDRALWTIMRFEYIEPAGGGLAVNRTYHNPGGIPTPVGFGYGEQIIYDAEGRLSAITMLDREGERPRRINAVTQTLFRYREDWTVMQEWRYANNKQFSGKEIDPWNSQASELDETIWFRLMQIDERGFLIEERPLSLSMKPLLFPDGAPIRRYRRDDCGRPIVIAFRDSTGSAASNRYGISEIRFSYDDRGRIAGWQTFDTEGAPIPRPGMSGAISGVYSYRDFDDRLVGHNGTTVDGRTVALPVDQP